ncbi:MAG: hypothetical protein HYV13_04095 [Candidatus Doudnabacteria bacterium]|nr:hypothetical protein [Candidatus Doudnabacteria bacterium]
MFASPDQGKGLGLNLNAEVQRVIAAREREARRLRKKLTRTPVGHPAYNALQTQITHLLYLNEIKRGRAAATR